MLRVYHRFSTNSSHAARRFLLVIVMVDLCHCRILPDIVGHCRILVLGRFIAQHISAHFSTILQFFDWNFPGMDVELPELRKAGEQGRRHEKELEGTVNRICCSLELKLQKISSCNGFSIHGGSGPQQSGLAKKTKAARAVHTVRSSMQQTPDISRHLQTPAIKVWANFGHSLPRPYDD